MSKHRIGTRSLRSLIVLKYRERRLVIANAKARKALKKYAHAYETRFGFASKWDQADHDWLGELIK